MSFDILSPETPILGRKFLEASAGTGKTFTIEHLVARLLLEQGLHLQEILIVSFTRAAVLELSQRIGANLRKLMQGEVGPIQAFTIHGFCFYLLQRFPFEADVGLELAEWSEAKEREERKTFFHRRILSGEYSKTQVLLLSKLFRGDEKSCLAQLSERPKGSIPLSFGEALSLFNQKLASLSPFPLRGDFSEISLHYKKMGCPDLEQQVLFLEQLLAKQSSSAEEFDRLIGMKPFILESLHPENKKVKSADFILPVRWTELCASLLPPLQEAADPRKILKKLQSEWREARSCLMQEQELCTPDEILEKTCRALKNSSFIQKVREKYKAVIIDEFQDTDALQWHIFHTLFGEAELKAFYLIGDPKQSIYAFRNADIYTYLSVRESFASEEIVCLESNFRSEPKLVEELNTLFCTTPWLEFPARNQIVPTLPLKAGKKSTCGEESGIVFFKARGNSKGKKRWPSTEMEEEIFFPFIAGTIEKLLQPLETIAILVKDRFQGQRVARFLSQRKIPSTYKRGERLADSPAFPALKEVIEAIHQGGKALNRALVGPLMGWKLDELLERETATAQLEVERLGQLLLEQGFPLFFSHLLQTSFHPEVKKVEDRALSHPHPTFYDDLCSIALHLIDKRDPEALLSSLEEIKEREIGGQTGGRGVQIVTVHGSKGLEFETVFLLGTASRHFSEEQEGEEREREAEKCRQFYVATTRAKSRLYIAIAEDEQGIPLSCASPAELFFKKSNNG